MIVVVVVVRPSGEVGGEEKAKFEIGLSQILTINCYFINAHYVSIQSQQQQQPISMEIEMAAKEHKLQFRTSEEQPHSWPQIKTCSEMGVAPLGDHRKCIRRKGEI